MRKIKIIGLILGVFILAGVLLVNFFNSQYVVPILMYHSVDADAQPENRLAVTADTFERQIHFLKVHNYNVISLEELVVLIREGDQIPAKTVVITLDDGYKDNFTYAFPILEKYQIPATLFIITNEVGRPQDDRLSWGQIQEMQDSGLIFFGSHCVGPEPLINIESEEELIYQIFASKKILEERLGRQVNLFSYPEGFFDDKIKALVVQAGYKGAVATNPGPDYPDDDPFALKRLRISENAANLFVFAVESSGYYTFMKEWKKRR